MSSKNDGYNGIVTKKDLQRIFVRSIPTELSWNYERQMNMAYAWSLLPVLRKIYPDKEERTKVLQRHLEFYNTTPYIITLPLGITTAMEEQRAKDIDNFDETSITNVKVAMMGPLAGIGDSVFWGTLRIIATGIGTSLSLTGNPLGPILYWLIYNVPGLIIRYQFTFLGYKLGSDVIVKANESGMMDKFTNAAAVVGLMVAGAMTAGNVFVTIPLSFGAEGMETSIQSIFDGIFPGILPLCVFGITWWMLKKKISPIAIMFILMAVGIAGAFFGVLA